MVFDGRADMISDVGNIFGGEILSAAVLLEERSGIPKRQDAPLYA